jgi:hypothetical protein
MIIKGDFMRFSLRVGGGACQPDLLLAPRTIIKYAAANEKAGCFTPGFCGVRSTGLKGQKPG